MLSLTKPEGLKLDISLSLTRSFTFYNQSVNSMMPSISKSRVLMIQNANNDVSKDSPVDSPRCDILCSFFD